MSRYASKDLLRVCEVLDEVLRLSIFDKQYPASDNIEAVFHEIGHLMTLTNEEFEAYVQGPRDLGETLRVLRKDDDDGEIMANAVAMLAAFDLGSSQMFDACIVSAQRNLKGNLSPANRAQAKELVHEAMGTAEAIAGAQVIVGWFDLVVGGSGAEAS